MKKLLFGMATTGLLLGGCASVPATSYNENVDEAKVAAVERVAQVRGVRVMWINLPTKPQL